MKYLLLSLSVLAITTKEIFLITPYSSNIQHPYVAWLSNCQPPSQ